MGLRRILSAIFLAAFATAAHAQKPLVLVVHGRGLLGRDSAQVRRDVHHSLEMSLRHEDASVSLDQSDVRLVWYADVLDARADGSIIPSCPTSQLSDAIRNRESMPSALSLIAMIAGPIFDAAARDDKNSNTEDVRALAGDLRYLADFDTRCAAERRVRDALREAHAENRKVIVISHSLGALVTWSALTHASAMHDTTLGAIDRWITIGSPLGATEIRQLVFGDDARLRKPANVREWINVIGTDDPFAVRTADSTSALTDIATAIAHTSPHDITSYLDDAATARAVLGAIRR